MHIPFCALQILWITQNTFRGQTLPSMIHYQYNLWRKYINIHFVNDKYFVRKMVYKVHFVHKIVFIHSMHITKGILWRKYSCHVLCTVTIKSLHTPVKCRFLFFLFFFCDVKMKLFFGPWPVACNQEDVRKKKLIRVTLGETGVYYFIRVWWLILNTAIPNYTRVYSNMQLGYTFIGNTLQ